VTTRTCPVCGEQHKEVELANGWSVLGCPRVGAGDLVTTGGLVSTEDVVAELRQRLADATADARAAVEELFAVKRRLVETEARESVWAEQWSAVRDEAQRLRETLEGVVRELEWSSTGAGGLPARTWARDLSAVLGATAATRPAPPPPGGPVVVEASGVEVEGAAKTGGDA
jgi:hypothetical protein